MDGKKLLAACCALAFVWGCSDDASVGGKVEETCSQPGETKCTTEGSRVVCQDGVYVPSPCESNEGCVAGECVRRCDLATFPKDCDGNVRITCGEEGYVVRESCGEGYSCVAGDCRKNADGGVNVGDDCDESSFAGRCDGKTSELKCVGGKVVSSACEPGYECTSQKCEKSTIGSACDEATFTSRCDGDLHQIVCKDGVETRESCARGMACSGGQCSSACTGNLSVCDSDGNQLLCEDNVIVPTPCPGSQKCVDGVCGTTCQSGYKGCSLDGASKLFCGADGLVKSEVCPSGFKCNGDTGECTDVAVDVDCTEETLPKQCSAEGEVVECVDGKVVKYSCANANESCYLGECHQLAPCGESTYTPKCIDEGARKVCKENMEYVETCAAGEVCHGGVCQKISTENECTDGGVACVSANIAKKCVNGVWQQYYCNVGTETCNSGECANKSSGLESCVESEYVASCDGNTREICEFGYISRYSCGVGRHCVSGICYDDVNIGDSCDEASFQRQCDEKGQLIACSATGKVESHSCGDKVCVAGECVACNDKNYKATCADAHTSLVCAGGVLTEEACGVGKHCDAGKCVDSPKPGDTCDPAKFHAYCSIDGKLLSCDGSVVVEKSCTGATPFCLAGACVECNPADGTKCAEGTGGGAASMITCDANGKKTVTSCASDEPACFMNSCAQCDPNAFEHVCVDASKKRMCDEKGKIVEISCGVKEQCENGACVKACETNADCDPHYVCDKTDRKCKFEPECTDIGKLECHTEAGKSVVRQCKAPGLWATTQTCQTGEVCGADDVDKNKFVCRGQECTGVGLTQCVDNAPAKCSNGRLEKVGSSCTGIQAYCVAGVCKECIHGTTPDVCTQKTSSIYEYKHCNASNAYESTACTETQDCVLGKGCVSKCGEGFVETCKDEGTVSRTRIVCDSAGKQVEKKCQYYEICQAGKCIPRSTAESCDAYTYDKNECVEDNKGNVYLEFCGPSGFSYMPCNDEHPGSVESGVFCGTVGDFTDVGCWQKCGSENATYCVHGSSPGMGKVGLCQAGKDYKGNAKVGIHLSAGLCDGNGVSNSCFISATDSKLVWNYFSCSFLNNNSSCDALTGTCKDFAVASCSTPEAKCVGNKAVTCALDPASISAKNTSGYVRIEEDCAKIDPKAECVTYTLHGMPVARCAAEPTLNFSDGTTSYQSKESTLGRCENGPSSSSIEQIYRIKSGSGSSWIRHSNLCSDKAGSKCVTGKTNPSASGKRYDFAYCN